MAWLLGRLSSSSPAGQQQQQRQQQRGGMPGIGPYEALPGSRGTTAEARRQKWQRALLGAAAVLGLVLALVSLRGHREGPVLSSSTQGELWLWLCGLAL